MITGAALRTVLDGVTQPHEGGFNVVDASPGSAFKVGRGSDGSVVLLTPPDTAPEAPTHLEIVRLDPRIRCTTTRADGLSSEQDHGLVEFLEHDEALLTAFLEVAAALIRLLGPDPAPGEVSKSMRQVVNLFATARARRSEVLGLWAELLVISLSSDPATMVDAWHTSIDDRFDFAAPGERVEVKATTRSDRVHHFNLVQLLPVEQARTAVVSIMTTRTGVGTTTGALVARLEGRLAGDPYRQMKIHLQVAETLGSDWMHQMHSAFDETQAKDSLRVLEAEGVPRVEPGPQAVLEVSLTVDCSDVPELFVIKSDLASSLLRR